MHISYNKESKVKSMAKESTFKDMIIHVWDKANRSTWCAEAVHWYVIPMNEDVPSHDPKMKYVIRISKDKSLCYYMHLLKKDNIYKQKRMGLSIEESNQSRCLSMHLNKKVCLESHLWEMPLTWGKHKKDARKGIVTKVGRYISKK